MSRKKGKKKMLRRVFVLAAALAVVLILISFLFLMVYVSILSSMAVMLTFVCSVLLLLELALAGLYGVCCLVLIANREEKPEKKGKAKAGGEAAGKESAGDGAPAGPDDAEEAA